jgi:hypothetical protein
MILSTHGFLASSISGVDADWLAYYNRVVTAGGSLSTTEQNATKTLVADLKSAGIWSSMKAIYPMVGASAAACAQNLKSSSFTGTFTSGWTFASTGVTPNGTSAYFDTNFNVLANAQLNSFSHSYYNRKTTQTGICGANDSSNYTLFFGGNTDINSQLNTAGGDFVTATVTNPQGLIIGNRTTSTIVSLFKNASKLISTTKNSLGLANLNYYIAARNLSGVPLGFDDKQYAFYHIGDGLTDTQASNFYTAVQAFQTTLSRNV